MRPAGRGDVDAVERVLRASYPVLMSDAYAADVLALALPLLTRAHPKLLGSGRFYVAEAGTIVVGCGGWSHEEPGGSGVRRGVAHIRHFATDAGWIGGGVGRLLYERCEADARAEGVSRFHCYSSLNGEPFYAALGFARVRPIEAPMTGGIAIPAILMRREIGPVRPARARRGAASRAPR